MSVEVVRPAVHTSLMTDPELVRDWWTAHVSVLTDISTAAMGLEAALKTTTAAAQQTGPASAQTRSAFDALATEGQRHLAVVAAAGLVPAIPDAEADRLFGDAIRHNAAWARDIVKSAKRRGVAWLGTAAKHARQADESQKRLMARLREIWPDEVGPIAPAFGSNPTGAWALENLPAFEEYYAAIEQVSLEFGASGDSLLETGSLEASAPAVDAARERMAAAAAGVRECPLPPDPASARHLDAALTALEAFAAAETMDELISSWVRAMAEGEAYSVAFATANGQI